MSFTNSQTFNPEILYVFDPWAKPGSRSQLHHHDFLEISIILEGEARYFVDGRHVSLGAGHVMVFNPGAEHGEEQVEDTYSHQLHIGLSNILLDDLPRNFFPNQRALLSLGKTQYSILEKAWELTKEFTEQQSDYQLMGKALIIEMLVMILRSIEHNQEQFKPRLSQTEKRQQNLVNHSIYYLENHHAEEITLEQLAQQLYVSPTHLSKVFREATGMSPINYLIQIRLKHANELLKVGELSIKEVASRVGYQDAYHFSKLFKKYYGVAPSKIEKPQE